MRCPQLQAMAPLRSARPGYGSRRSAVCWLCVSHQWIQVRALMAARQCDEAAAMMPPAAAEYLLQVCLRFDLLLFVIFFSPSSVFLLPFANCSSDRF